MPWGGGARREAMSAQDPFYLVKEEIQDSVHNVGTNFLRWEQLPPGGPERDLLFKDLSAACDSIEWQLEELNKAIAVAERDPVRFNVDDVELSRRRRWTATTSSQIESLKRSLQSPAPERRSPSTSRDAAAAARRELVRAADGPGRPPGPRPGGGIARENDAFIAGMDDRQALLIREQDTHLDEMSESLAKIGGMGIAIHDELGSQDKLINDLQSDVEATNSRLETVQRKMAAVMKRAGIKGQIMLIVFLVVLLIILVALVVYS